MQLKISHARCVFKGNVLRKWQRNTCPISCHTAIQSTYNNKSCSLCRMTTLSKLPICHMHKKLKMTNAPLCLSISQAHKAEKLFKSGGND